MVADASRHCRRAWRSIDVVRQFSRHKGIGTLLIYRDLHENKQGTIAGWVAEQLPAGR